MSYTKKDMLYALLNGTRFYVATHSPGDGVTRYRFFRRENGESRSDYFGPKSGIYTALGISEAVAFASGLQAACERPGDD